jgi:diguanylate cyclase (GGDEF)-like protein/PAS domain S-box-containing protein
LANLLQHLFDSAPDGMVVSRLRDGTIVLANEAMGRLLGHPVSDIIGRSSDDFGLWPGPAEREEVTRQIPRPAELRVPVEASLTTGDGRMLEVEVAAEIIELDGEPHAFAITRDVTPRKAAERALRDSEQRFRTLVQSSRDGIIVTDAAGRLTYVSPGAAEILGKSAEQLLDASERRLIHPDDLQVRDRSLAALSDRESPHPMAELRMRHSDGTWRWVETVDTDRIDDPVVRGIITNFRDVTERKTTEDAMAFRALHDPLTGLPNRRLLDDRIEQALARANRVAKVVAVLFCDLDGFKEVNDRFGHETGDRVLIEMAGRLLRAIRPGDSLARLGGDEFVIVCGDLGSPLDASGLAARVADVIRAPIELEGTEVVITASIGIATAAGRRPARADAGTLLRNADAAMYRAKQSGRNRWEMFDAEMLELARARLALIDEIGTAVATGQFEAVFQPVVDLRSGRTVGAEALLRWRHPTRGLLLPEQFLEVAESSGLIVDIGEWMLNEALRRLVEWQAIAPDIWVSLNVSGRQLGDRGVQEMLTRGLAGNPVGESLRLELTESVLIEHSPAVVADLKSAVSMGIRIGIDDFGTGYSSLTYLQRLPISFLKIDQGFLTDLRPGVAGEQRDSGLILLAAIIDLSRTLDIEVIAEGIETAGQAAALVELRCLYGQGFHFAMPDSAEALSHRLLSEQSAP